MGGRWATTLNSTSTGKVELMELVSQCLFVVTVCDNALGQGLMDIAVVRSTVAITPTTKVTPSIRVEAVLDR